MFGITLLDHDSRYEMAEEWVQIATRLWSDPEPFDFNGRFYQLKKASLRRNRSNDRDRRS